MNAQLGSITATYSSHLSTRCLKLSLTVIGNVALLQEYTYGGFIWHRCTFWKPVMSARRRTSGDTRMVSPAKNRSNVSHLMSTPLTSHNTLQTSTHSHTCLNCLDPWRAGWKYHPPVSVASFTSLDSNFWLCELNMTKIFFNSMYFPPWPQWCVDRPLCPGNMPGISSLYYPCFPIRGRLEVCAARAVLALSLWCSAIA